MPVRGVELHPLELEPLRRPAAAGPGPPRRSAGRSGGSPLSSARSSVNAWPTQSRPTPRPRVVIDRAVRALANTFRDHETLLRVFVVLGMKDGRMLETGTRASHEGGRQFRDLLWTHRDAFTSGDPEHAIDVWCTASSTRPACIESCTAQHGITNRSELGRAHRRALPDRRSVPARHAARWFVDVSATSVFPKGITTRSDHLGTP